MLGLLPDGTSPAAATLREHGLDLATTRPNPLCAYLLTKRAFEIASCHAAHQGDPGIGPQHLLYGVLLDAATHSAPNSAAAAVPS